MKDLVIVGAGGLGRELCWVVQEINRVQNTWNLLGFLDDDAHAIDGFSDYDAIIGPVEHYCQMKRPYVVCAIGMPVPRRKVVSHLDAMDARWATLIDPSASIGIDSTLGEGCVLRKHAIVTVNVKVGSHVFFGLGAQASHDSQIGDFCTLCGHTDINGGAILDEGVFLGSHACVMPRIRIGAGARIGAGTVAARKRSSGNDGSSECRGETPLVGTPQGNNNPARSTVKQGLRLSWMVIPHIASTFLRRTCRNSSGRSCLMPSTRIGSRRWGRTSTLLKRSSPNGSAFARPWRFRAGPRPCIWP